MFSLRYADTRPGTPVKWVSCEGRYKSKKKACHDASWQAEWFGMTYKVFNIKKRRIVATYKTPQS